MGLNSVLANNILLFTIMLLLVASVGVVLIRNSINLLLLVEVIFLSSNLNFIVLGWWFCDLTGQVISLFILAIAAAETTIALSIIVLGFQFSVLSYSVRPGGVK
jgi:NADH-quinone oxidoreductase subunit K